MKILHTSDWHLGRMLYGRKRYHEFEDLFKWLLETIQEEQIELLLVAGDIFDTTAPSNQASEMYYKFITDLTQTTCKNVIIIGGNHDSPSFINAPKSILNMLNTTVVGNISDDIEDEIQLVTNEANNESVIVASVPYLRERDVRKYCHSQDYNDRIEELNQGIKAHYAEVSQAIRSKYPDELEMTPVIAMGHLFTAGGKTVQGDGVRELYVGNINHVSSQTTFGHMFDYVALGHLHVAQRVGSNDFIRYSGSPLPIGFGEAKQQKKVFILQTAGKQINIKEIAVPTFQNLEIISGDLEDIKSRIAEIKSDNISYWIEIQYTGKELAIQLTNEIAELVADSMIEVLRIKDLRKQDYYFKKEKDLISVEDIDEISLFRKFLKNHELTEAVKLDLENCYVEIVNSVHEEDGL